MATNVAARGLDIPEVDLVIQSSPPKVSGLYFDFILLLLLGPKTKWKLCSLLSCD